MTQSFDWSSFTVRVNVSAPGKSLYDAWATRDGMEHWFLRVSEYKAATGSLRAGRERAEKGDHYRWLWHGWPDDTVEHGTILDCNGLDMFRFSFGKAGNCTVSIKKEEGETIVELKQEDIPTDETGRHYWHVGCKGGWTFYLANLKSLYEGGIDLRNKNERLTNMINS